MLEYMFHNGDTKQPLYDVTIKDKEYPSVGNYIYEIKNADKILYPKSDIPISKTILIFYQNKLIGSAAFRGDTCYSWIGSPRSFWSASVQKCQMACCNKEHYIFEIFAQPPYAEVPVLVHPILPRFFASIKKALPKGG